jgi:hypothetical protein
MFIIFVGGGFIYEQIFNDEVPFIGLRDPKVIMNVLSGERPLRRIDQTMPKGLTDDIWERMIGWWDDFPSGRPLLHSNLSTSTTRDTMTASIRASDEIVTGPEHSTKPSEPMVSLSLLTAHIYTY